MRCNFCINCAIFIFSSHNSVVHVLQTHIACCQVIKVSQVLTNWELSRVETFHCTYIVLGYFRFDVRALQSYV